MKKTTKRALLLSALSLLLCVSMLVGSTFAWFTDSVTSAGNKIQSGTLKIDLELYDKDTKTWNSIKETKDPIFNYDLWEPGYTAVQLLKIENEGNLALKWYAKFVSATKLSKLADVIDVYVCPSATELTYPTSRELTGYTKVGTVAEFVNTIESTTYGNLTPAGETGSVAYLGIALKMQETANNDYQNLDLGGIFDIQILATQYTYEKDSFDDQYDKDATFLPAWDGSVEAPTYDDVNKVYEVSTPAQLAGFAEMVNGGQKNINAVLTSDIDLGGQLWTPMVLDINTPGYSGTFDGNGHTISNYVVRNIRSYGCGGLIGYSTGTIKNLTVVNANVRSTFDAGAIVGYSYGDVINCHVVDSTVAANQAGGVAGLLASSDMKDCSVTGSTVIGANGAGGLVGITMDVNTNVTDNAVSNTKIMANSANEEVYWHAATGNSSVANNTLSGNTVTSYGEKVKMISSADELLALGGTSATGVYALTDDIDLGGADFATIGAAYGKSLTILGNGYTISNATTAHTNHNGMKHHGMFYAYTNSTLNISDLNIETVNIDATADTERNYGAAVVVAFTDGGSNVILTNVDVRNCQVLNDTPDIGDEAGVYVGYQTGTLTMVDCDSVGCTVAGETAQKTGAFIGMVNGTATLTNCTTDLTIGTCNRVSGTLTEN